MLSCKVFVKDKNDLSTFYTAITDLYGIKRYRVFEYMFNDYPEGYYLAYDAELEQVMVGYSAFEQEKYELTLSLDQFNRFLWYLKEIEEFGKSIEDTKEELDNLFKAVTQKYHLVHPYISRSLGYLNYNKEYNYYCYGTKGTSGVIETSFTAEECDELKQMFPEAIREKAITK